jgi:hypothetical protein
MIAPSKNQKQEITSNSSRYDALADAPTAGKRPLPAMRCYGPTEALNNKSFKLPDFELIA